MNVNALKFNYVSNVAEAEKAKIEKAVNVVKKSLTAYANSYIAVCKALHQFETTGYYKKILDGSGKVYKDFKDFARDYFNLERSAVNDSLKIYRKYFNIVDEDGKPSPFKIGEHEAKDYSKTALIQLSVLDDDELKNAVAEGLKPDMKIKDVKEVIDKVHEKKGKNGATNPKPKKHPASNFTLDELKTYVSDAMTAYMTSDAYKAIASEKGFSDGFKATLVVFSKEFAKLTDLQTEALTIDIHEAKANSPIEK